MSSYWGRFFEDVSFWPTVIFDYLLYFSLIVVFLYALGLSLAKLIPSSFKTKPYPMFIPLLFALALTFSFSGTGRRAVLVANDGVQFLFRKFEFIQALPLIMTGIWLAGVLLGGAVLTMKGRGLFKALVGLAPAPFDPVFIETLAAAGLRRPVAVKEAGSDGPIASWGPVRPVIVVPAGFVLNYDPEERRGIYFHELMHIKHGDGLKILAVGLVKLILWFNPAIRSVLNRYLIFLEIACDRAVIRESPISPGLYAGLITKNLAVQNKLLPGFSGAYLEAAHRLSYIFNDPAIRPGSKKRLKATAVLWVGLVFFSFLAAYPAAPPPAPPDRLLAPGPNGEIKVAVRSFHWQGLLSGYSIVDIE